MPPRWLTVLAWASLATAGACALAVVLDLYAGGHRQRMRVMEAVWPVTALYWGPVALWAYLRFGRRRSPRWSKEHGNAGDEPGWVPVALGVSHCGGGCTFGDIVAETVIFLAGWTLLGAAFYAELLGDFALALLLGIVFQYFAIAPMRGLGLRKGLVQAAKADVLSLAAFEVGLFAWMALMAFVFFPEPHRLTPASPVYWFLMQIGMVIGFFTAWPANVWLISRGVKESM